MKKPEISLRVPARREYALVLRLALGGVAILKDLDAGTLDDLRSASDEACDCLLHQAREAAWLELNVFDGGEKLMVSLSAEFSPEKADEAYKADEVYKADEGYNADEVREDETEISKAVLETLIPVVEMRSASFGGVERIDLTLPKAVPVGA